MHEVVEEMHFAFINAKARLGWPALIPTCVGILVSPQIYQTITEPFWLPLHLSHFPLSRHAYGLGLTSCVFVWHWDLRMEFWMLWMHGSGTLIKLWWAKLDDSTSWELNSWHEILIQDSTTANNKGISYGSGAPPRMKIVPWHLCQVLWYAERDWEDSGSDWCPLTDGSGTVPWPVGITGSAEPVLWIWGSAERFRILKCVVFGKDFLIVWMNKLGLGFLGLPILTSSQVYSVRSRDLTQNLGSFSGFNCTSTCIISAGERATHRAAEVGNLQTLRLQAVFRFPYETRSRWRWDQNSNVARNLKWLVDNGADINAPGPRKKDIFFPKPQSLHPHHH